MATVYSDRALAAIPARFQEKGVFTDVGTYEAVANPIADVLMMVKVAPGVTVLDVRIVHDALGASSTLAVGDNDSASYWRTATSSAAAGGGTATSTAFPKQYPNGDTLRVTVAGAAITGTVTVYALMTAEIVDLV